MDESVARQRLTAERADVAKLLKDAESAGTQDRDTEDEPGDYADSRGGGQRRLEGQVAQQRDGGSAQHAIDRVGILPRLK